VIGVDHRRLLGLLGAEQPVGDRGVRERLGGLEDFLDLLGRARVADAAQRVHRETRRPPGHALGRAGHP